jgi:prepilin-type processing-associated H-X9-DG protein
VGGEFTVYVRSVHSRGISLVEILLVVAIIALLLAILMPVFEGAKAQSRQVKCVSNMAQLGKAFHWYLSDWNGVYPSPGGEKGDYNYWSQSGRGGLVGYVRSNGGVGSIWCCPEQTHWKGIYPARTYSMNSYIRKYADLEWKTAIKFRGGCQESQIEETRRTILLYEGIPVTPEWDYTDDYIYRCGNWSCVRGWAPEELFQRYRIDWWLPWHGPRSNYLYCDGHVASRRPARRGTNEWSTPQEICEWWVQKSGK